MKENNFFVGIFSYLHHNEKFNFSFFSRFPHEISATHVRCEKKIRENK